ncbi:MAG: class I SAM-dependent methyltransferase [Actinobacteria bacterium]|nr:class I SAM-dependent methyltransferase [Actinomycetota bacterium]
MTGSEGIDLPRSIEMVRNGYNLAAGRYAAARDLFENEPHLDRFAKLLPPSASVLDVGCGSGDPVDRYLVNRGYEVTGFDIAPGQIKLARVQVPEGSFEVRNMLELKTGEFNMDGVVSLYAVFHTQRAHHRELLRRFGSFVRPGGALLLTMGAEEWEGTDPDFHGVEMYWSHFDADTNRKLVEAAGFDIEYAEIDETNGEAHQVILAVRGDCDHPANPRFR